MSIFQVRTAAVLAALLSILGVAGRLQAAEPAGAARTRTRPG